MLQPPVVVSQQSFCCKTPVVILKKFVPHNYLFSFLPFFSNFQYLVAKEIQCNSFFFLIQKNGSNLPNLKDCFPEITICRQ
jgi:hypothetical protein